MLDNETKQRINSARQILVGKVPDPKAQVEQITTALIYKFMDDMDRENEELGGKATFFIGILKEFAWGKLMSRSNSGEQRWDLYTRALVEFSKAKHVPELFRTIFKGAFLPYRDPETLNLFLKEISGFSYGNSENLGNAFEYLLSILGSQGDAGQFRTPWHIIDFMVEVVDPGKTEKILDPACGTSGFLISAFKHIQRANSSNFKPNTFTPEFAQPVSGDVATLEIQSNGKYRGDKLSPDDRKRLTRNIVGYDISPDMVRLSLVNMYLHGFPTPEIHEYDSLTYEERWDDNFDVILANPPFMTPKGGIRPHSRFQVNANRSEVLFVDYIAEHLTINGKAGIIVPEGIIFQSSNAYKDLRKWLVEDNFLWAVVSLPAGVFQPYSGVKTSILFFDKQLAKKSTEILFVKVENDGFDLGAQRRRIDKNDLPEAYRILRDGLKGKKSKFTNANWVKKSEIAATGDYNLTGDRYRETVDYSRIKWPVKMLGEVTEVISGQSPEGKYYNETGEGFPFYQGKTEFTHRYIGEPQKWTTNITKIALKDDVLMSVRAPVGPVNIATQKICIGRGLAAIRANDQILPVYIYQLLANMQDKIKGGGGAVFDSINRSQIEKIKIPLPPLEVQNEIVAELESYQRIIDGSRQIVENWKPRIKIDPDWPMVKLGDMCDVRDGTHDSPKQVLKGYPLITSKNIKNGQLDFSSVSFISKEDFTKVSKRSYVAIGDIIMPMIGTIGGACLIKSKDVDFAIKNVALFKKSEQILPEYLLNILDSDFVAAIFTNQSVGATQKFVSLGILRGLVIPLPPLKAQKQIIDLIETEHGSIAEVKKLIEIHELKIKDKIAELWGE